MTNKVEEIKKDVEEVRTLLKSATRKRVQDVLDMQLKKYEIELQQAEEAARTASENSSDTKAVTPASNKPYTVIVRNYSWDESDKFLKIYVSLPGVSLISKDKVESIFTDRSLTLVVNELEGKNHNLMIKQLAERIKPTASYHKIKTDMVVIFAAKEELKKWQVVTLEERRALDARKPKTDNKDDPSAGLMSMMKQMYDDGDDNMKRMLNKTWYESQQKNLQGGSGGMTDGMGGMGMPGMGGMGMPGMGGMGMPGMGGMGMPGMGDL